MALVTWSTRTSQAVEEVVANLYHLGDWHRFSTEERENESSVKGLEQWWGKAPDSCGNSWLSGLVIATIMWNTCFEFVLWGFHSSSPRDPDSGLWYSLLTSLWAAGITLPEILKEEVRNFVYLKVTVVRLTWALKGRSRSDFMISV